MNDVSTRFQGKGFIEVVEGGYYDKGQEQHALFHDEDGMPKHNRTPMKSNEAAPPKDDVKQAADEAAKAAQEAAKVAAEASQNIMQGISSFGGGLFGGGKQQKSGGGGLLGGFGFGGGPAASAKPAQNQSKTAKVISKTAVNDKKVDQTKPVKAAEPKLDTILSHKEITEEDLERKPFTANMTSRQRWYWSFRMIQQVNSSDSLPCISSFSSTLESLFI